MRLGLTMLLAGAAMGLALPAAASPAVPPRMVPQAATSAPVGFTAFCARSPQECENAPSSINEEVMTAARWREVSALNADVNASITSADDAVIYGQTEYWTLPGGAGDCEDYVLLKKKLLLKAGYEPSALLITVVLDEHGEGHAVLTLATESGDFVLDNRRDEILPFTATGYRYLKRQSQEDPMQWVSLEGRSDASVPSASPSP